MISTIQSIGRTTEAKDRSAKAVKKLRPNEILQIVFNIPAPATNPHKLETDDINPTVITIVAKIFIITITQSSDQEQKCSSPKTPEEEQARILEEITYITKTDPLLVGHLPEDQEIIKQKLCYVMRYLGEILDTSQVSLIPFSPSGNNGKQTKLELDKYLDSRLKNKNSAVNDSIDFLSTIGRLHAGMDAFFKRIDGPAFLEETTLNLSNQLVSFERSMRQIRNIQIQPTHHPEQKLKEILSFIFHALSREPKMHQVLYAAMKEGDFQKCLGLNKLIKKLAEMYNPNTGPTKEEREFIAYHLTLAGFMIERDAKYFVVEYDNSKKGKDLYDKVNDRCYVMLSNVLRAITTVIDAVFEPPIELKMAVNDSLSDMYSAIVQSESPLKSRVLEAFLGATIFTLPRNNKQFAEGFQDSSYERNTFKLCEDCSELVLCYLGDATAHSPAAIKSSIACSPSLLAGGSKNFLRTPHPPTPLTPKTNIHTPMSSFSSGRSSFLPLQLPPSMQNNSKQSTSSGPVLSESSSSLNFISSNVLSSNVLSSTTSIHTPWHSPLSVTSPTISIHTPWRSPLSITSPTNKSTPLSNDGYYTYAEYEESSEGSEDEDKNYYSPKG